MSEPSSNGRDRVSGAAESQTDNTASRRLVIVAGGLVVGAIVAELLSRSNVSQAISSVIVPGVPGLLTAVDEALIYRRNSRVDRLKTSLRIGMARRALPLALTVVLALVFFERVVILLIGASGAVTVWLADPHASALAGFAFATVLGAFFVVVPMMFAMLFSARYLTHRIATRQYGWTAGVALATVAADIGILAVYIDIDNTPFKLKTVVIVYITMGVLLLAGALVGTRWAMREDRAYVMARLFSRLTHEEQDTVIELVTPSDDLRGVSPAEAQPILNP